MTWLLDSQEVQLLLIANPDGRKVAETQSTRLQRKNRNENSARAAARPSASI